MKTVSKLPTLVGKVKKVRGQNEHKHVGCGGVIMEGGTYTSKLPLGFGFRGGKFVIDMRVEKGITGFCLKCNKGGRFAKSVTGEVKVPRKFNSKASKTKTQKITAKDLIG